MVNDLVLEFIQSLVRLERIGVGRGTRLHMLPNFNLKSFFFFRKSVTSVRTLPLRRKMLRTVVLSLPPVPVTLRTLTCCASCGLCRQ
jgi:hypothetical protein